METMKLAAASEAKMETERRAATTQASIHRVQKTMIRVTVMLVEGERK